MPVPNLHEQWAIARYLAKWFLLLSPVAVVVGTIAAAFLEALQWATETRWEHDWLLFLLPLAGLGSAALYHYYGRSVEAGNNLLVDEIHEPGAGVQGRITPLIFGTTVISHLFGASVGREGTAVQMGGGVAGVFDRWFRLESADRRILLMAGVAAGFGAVFGTPIAGAVFAMEVLSVGRLRYEGLIPILFAALVADFTVGVWNVHHTHYHIAIITADGRFPWDASLLAKAALAGVAFGIAALIFTELTHTVGKVFRSAIRLPLLRPVVGGLLTIALVFLVGSRDYLGLGVASPDPGATTILSSFEPGGASTFSWWWKIAFTALAIGSSFKGGEVTPLFFIGSTLGNRLAALLRAPADLFAGLGFVGVFAAAANTPLACTIMGVELFGADALPYMAVVCFVAYVVSGHTGIYLSQRVATPKVGVVPEDVPLRQIRELRDATSDRVAVRFFHSSPDEAPEGPANMTPTVHTISRRDLALIRIYVGSRERRRPEGILGFLRTRPLYRAVVDAAREHGLLGASAQSAHYGFASSTTRLAVGLSEIPNEPVLLVVELIGTSEQLDSFCRAHGDLIAGKVIVHKTVEHWHVEAGVVVVDDQQAEGPPSG